MRKANRVAKYTAAVFGRGWRAATTPSTAWTSRCIVVPASPSFLLPAASKPRSFRSSRSRWWNKIRWPYTWSHVPATDARNSTACNTPSGCFGNGLGGQRRLRLERNGDSVYHRSDPHRRLDLLSRDSGSTQYLLVSVYALSA